MILVDVIVPSVEKNYDFNLDENAKIEMVLEEIAGMICQKEQCTIIGDKNQLLLCKFEGQVVLDKQMSLAQSGIINGDRLLLI